MSLHGWPALYALFAWWFSTGLIIYLDNLPTRTFRWSMLGATVLFALSLYGLAASAADASLRGAYIAFTCGLLAWGWQEISFYTGFVTGPTRPPCAEGCGGWKHLGHAIHVSLYHELAILASAAAVFALTRGAANPFGAWTFAVLWWMHQSAKLNVMLGVPNISEEFLPPHLTFLRSFLARKPMNLLFPVSITVSMVIEVLLIQRAWAPGASAGTAAGFSFLAAMMGLAILEHWFLVVRLPVNALWRWSMGARKVAHACDIEIVAGFLGAGKTTVMRRLLAAADPARKTVVLVNDFGALGVDGALLQGRGAAVVELPNGCICCSLRDDLATQLREVITRFAPKRVLIEPSGIADVAALLGVLEGPVLRPLVASLRVCTVLDAGAFLSDYARMPSYFEAQASLAPTLVLNKADLATPAELRLATDTLRAINPGAAILPSVFGVTQEADLLRPGLAPAHAAGLPHLHHHGLPADLQSWSARINGKCDPQGLHALLEAVAGGAYGQVERVKGIARAGAGWVHFDVAGGRSSMAAFAARGDEQPRVVAIGRAVDQAGLQAAFAACAMRAAA